MQRIPQIWPGWQADELIGQGSFGKVYRASRTVGGHTSLAAVKVIEIPAHESEIAALRDMGMDALSVRSYFEETAQSVIREIAVMDELKGAPHVVHIEDYQLSERDDGVGWTIFIRMELLEALSAYQARAGMPSPHETAVIGAHICDALAMCHTAGLIHRDVKPANVFRSQFGDYKLGDFGLARRMEEGSRSTKSHAGTEAFMAPEVAGGHYDERVDVYSLGIMLYRWLNGGRPPFVGASEQPTRALIEKAQYRRLCGERPPLPAGEGVPAALAQVVRRACEPDPARRWESAEAFGTALQAWLDGKPAPVGGEETGEAGTQAGTGGTYDPLEGLGAVAAGGKARGGTRSSGAHSTRSSKTQAKRQPVDERLVHLQSTIKQAGTLWKAYTDTVPWSDPSIEDDIWYLDEEEFYEASITFKALEQELGQLSFGDIDSGDNVFAWGRSIIEAYQAFLGSTRGKGNLVRQCREAAQRLSGELGVTFSNKAKPREDRTAASPSTSDSTSRQETSGTATSTSRETVQPVDAGSSGSKSDGIETGAEYFACAIALICVALTAYEKITAGAEVIETIVESLLAGGLVYGSLAFSIPFLLSRYSFGLKLLGIAGGCGLLGGCVRPDYEKVVNGTVTWGYITVGTEAVFCFFGGIALVGWLVVAISERKTADKDR